MADDLLKKLCFQAPFGNEKPEPIILTTRLRLARNIEKRPFPAWAKDPARKEVMELCRKALQNTLKKSLFFEIEKLSELDKKILVERHFISRELGSAPSGGAVIISYDHAISVMINEEDHMRMQSIRGGLDFKKAWKTLDTLDSALEQELPLAFSKELGYLTACPTNIGTGMRASAMLHLPGLVLAGQMEKVVRAVNQLGIAVRGLYGEGSEASGSMFQISNQQTLGENELGIIERIESVLKATIEQENNARYKLLEQEPERFFDRLGRAYGMLQNSRVMPTSEALNMLSLMRLATDMGYLPDSERLIVDRLFMNVQPGHLELMFPGALDEAHRDLTRAKLLRDHFALVPALNFEGK